MIVMSMLMINNDDKIKDEDEYNNMIRMMIIITGKQTRETSKQVITN